MYLLNPNHHSVDEKGADIQCHVYKSNNKMLSIVFHAGMNVHSTKESIIHA